MLRNLPCKRIECDEIWNFCYAKDKNLPDNMKGHAGVGSMWTWTAIDAETKLIISWRLGSRDAENANFFMADVYHRLANRIQMTTDGLKLYIEAVESSFGGEIDYAMLIKKYGNAGDASPETRTRPENALESTERLCPVILTWIYFRPATRERQNLNIRMQNRRFTRLTSAFSKKAEMLAYCIAIMFCYHNFVRVHSTMKTTPAIKAGIETQRWTIENMVDLIPPVVYNTRPKKKSSDKD